ncbi:MAG: SGNH/GDSL hydrolase family protein [Myxococcales bacterium]|nr:SGNH/GDSL hydrolase family protein [Myxococcales bacterium]
MSRLLLLIALLASSCTSSSTPPVADARADRQPATVGDSTAPAERFLALGDSYTIGERVTPAERWPVQLGALLAKAGQPVAAPEIIARTGWTTDELDAGIDAAAPSGRYALVSLLIGVNDQYRGGSANDYRPRFERLLARAIAFAGDDARRVIVLSIPDWGVTPFAPAARRQEIGAAIDAFNAENRAASSARGARYVDVTAISREAASDTSLVAGDGLHPSGKMYRRWAEAALSSAREALATRGR